jgi:ceramide glucosyltransferase
MKLVAVLCACLAMLGLVYQGAALAALWFFRRRPLPRPVAGELPGLTVLKPLRGLSAETEACLASFCQQDYPRFQIMFGVAAADDPAAGVVAALAARFPQVEMELVHCPQTLGINPKVSTLRQLVPRARYDWLVIADSDVLAPPDLLARLAAALAEPGVGLTSCLYRAGPPATLGSALEALAISADFIPSVAVAFYLEGVSFALGAVMAVRREALAQMGGLAAIADHLADDYQLGHGVHRAGWRVTLLPLMVSTWQPHTSLAGFFSHQLRWARTYRVCRPRGFFGYGITFVAAWSLLAWWLSGWSFWGGVLWASALAARTLVAWGAARLLGAGLSIRAILSLLPLKDMASFVIWILSFLGRQVVWQGRRYRVKPDGRLEAQD